MAYRWLVCFGLFLPTLEKQGWVEVAILCRCIFLKETALFTVAISGIKCSYNIHTIKVWLKTFK